MYGHEALHSAAINRQHADPVPRVGGRRLSRVRLREQLLEPREALAARSRRALRTRELLVLHLLEQQPRERRAASGVRDRVCVRHSALAEKLGERRLMHQLATGALFARERRAFGTRAVGHSERVESGEHQRLQALPAAPIVKPKQSLAESSANATHRARRRRVGRCRGRLEADVLQVDAVGQLDERRVEHEQRAQQVHVELPYGTAHGEAEMERVGRRGERAEGRGGQLLRRVVAAEQQLHHEVQSAGAREAHQNAVAARVQRIELAMQLVHEHFDNLS